MGESFVKYVSPKFRQPEREVAGYLDLSTAIVEQALEDLLSGVRRIESGFTVPVREANGKSSFSSDSLRHAKAAWRFFNEIDVKDAAGITLGDILDGMGVEVDRELITAVIRQKVPVRSREILDRPILERPPKAKLLKGSRTCLKKPKASAEHASGVSPRPTEPSATASIPPTG